MQKIDFTGRSVLITGGTKGIGLATALEFARAGARTHLTYRWGSSDLNNLKELFEKEALPNPSFYEADASQEEDTRRLITEIRAKEERIDYFISNVGFSARIASLRDYKKRSLYKTLDYSTWPLLDYTKTIREVFGSYPRVVMGVSSDGPDHYYQGYDFVAASKALLEFFGKYLGMHLSEEGSRVNILRCGMVKTDSFKQIFGEAFFTFLEEEGYQEDILVSPEECGRAILALCSDYFSALNAQIITLDRGLPLRDNLMMRYFNWLARVDKNPK